MTSQALLVCLDFSSSLLFILALFFPSHPCSFIPCLPPLPSFLPSFLQLSPSIHLFPPFPVFPCSPFSSLCLCLFFVFFSLILFFGLARPTLWLHYSSLNHSHPVSLPFSPSLDPLCHPDVFLPDQTSFTTPPPHPTHTHTHKHIIFTSRCKPFLPPSTLPLLLPCF